MIENLDILIGLIIFFALDLYQDLSSEGRLKREYWQKSKSWVYKWKRDSNGNFVKNNKPLWYYLNLYSPAFKEDFPYSSTFLVFLTDGWHLIKTVKLVILSLIIMQFVQITPYFLLDVGLFHIVRFLTFELIYNRYKK